MHKPEARKRQKGKKERNLKKSEEEEEDGCFWHFEVDDDGDVCVAFIPCLLFPSFCFFVLLLILLVQASFTGHLYDVSIVHWYKADFVCRNRITHKSHRATHIFLLVLSFLCQIIFRSLPPLLFLFVPSALI
jgi:hypothetical protein